MSAGRARKAVAPPIHQRVPIDLAEAPRTRVRPGLLRRPLAGPVRYWHVLGATLLAVAAYTWLASNDALERVSTNAVASATSGEQRQPGSVIAEPFVPTAADGYDVVGTAVLEKLERVSLEDGQVIGEGVLGGVWRVRATDYRPLDVAKDGVRLSRPMQVIEVYSLERPNGWETRRRAYVYGFLGRSDERFWGDWAPMSIGDDRSPLRAIGAGE